MNIAYCELVTERDAQPVFHTDLLLVLTILNELLQGEFAECGHKWGILLQVSSAQLSSFTNVGEKGTTFFLVFGDTY